MDFKNQDIFFSLFFNVKEILPPVSDLMELTFRISCPPGIPWNCMGLLFSTSGREKSMVSFTLERGYAFLRVLKSD